MNILCNFRCCDVCRKRAKKKKLGFTNKLAVMVMVFLAVGLFMGFVLAWRSISFAYTGALVCFTVVFTPIGTACSIVLSRIVDKSRAENTCGKHGKGITYAAAEANGFAADTTLGQESPAI